MWRTASGCHWDRPRPQCQARCSRSGPGARAQRMRRNDRESEQKPGLWRPGACAFPASALVSFLARGAAWLEGPHRVITCSSAGFVWQKVHRRNSVATNDKMEAEFNGRWKDSEKFPPRDTCISVSHPRGHRWACAEIWRHFLPPLDPLPYLLRQKQTYVHIIGT